MKHPRTTRPGYLPLLFLSCLAVNSGLAADDEPANGRQIRPFSIHDLDQDGRLSREEYGRFLAHLEQRREQAEQAGRARRPPLRFDEIDRNGDDYLDEDEMISALNRRLERHRQYRNRDKRW